MKLGLAENSTLESLHLTDINGRNDTSFGGRLSLFFVPIELSSLCTWILYQDDTTESDASTAMRSCGRCMNESLETFSMAASMPGFEDYSHVFVIQPNTTLKSLICIQDTFIML
jgi:hypothetical protein